MLHEPACLIDFSFYDYHHAGSQAFVVGFGQIGAGTVHPPLEAFEKAVLAYAKKLGFEA